MVFEAETTWALSEAVYAAPDRTQPPMLALHRLSSLPSSLLHYSCLTDVLAHLCLHTSAASAEDHQGSQHRISCQRSDHNKVEFVVIDEQYCQ